MRQRHMSLQKKFAEEKLSNLLHRVNTEIKYTILYDQNKHLQENKGY